MWYNKGHSIEKNQSVMETSRTCCKESVYVRIIVPFLKDFTIWEFQYCFVPNGANALLCMHIFRKIVIKGHGILLES